MCGRFALDATAAQLVELFGLAGLEEFPPRFNIAPTQPVLAVVLNGPRRAPGSNLPEREALLVRWGLIPAWAKNPNELPLLFNARSESAAEKASFKAAFRHRRALIPATGFYEWRRSGGRRSQPYHVRPKRGGVIAFAGLVETWLEPGGSEIDTGAILTTDATGEIARIHHRMPVVIHERDFTRWLDCRFAEPRDVADLLAPAEADFFEAVPVSEKVNKAENMGLEVQEPVVGAEPDHSADARRAAPPAQMELF